MKQEEPGATVPSPPPSAPHAQLSRSQEGKCRGSRLCQQGFDLVGIQPAVHCRRASMSLALLCVVALALLTTTAGDPEFVLRIPVPTPQLWQCGHQ
jgi:hypothetical protein